MLFRHSLFFSDLRAREDDIFDPHNGTCEWILRTSSTDDHGGESSSSRSCDSSLIADSSSQAPDFLEWPERGERIYWITGEAGSGKSTLVKHITAHPITKARLRIWAGDSELLVPCLFFRRYGTSDLLRSLRGMIRSLLWQIVWARPQLTTIMVDDGTTTLGQSDSMFRSDGTHTWTQARLLKALKRFVQQMPSDLFLCIFIDGLDESTDDIHSLLDVLNLLQGSPRVKICVSR